MNRLEHARRIARAQTLAAIAALIAAALLYPFVSRASPSSGSAAPDFALKDVAGHNLRLSEYRGDVVVLSFWASWCGPCRSALSQLNQLPATGADDAPVVLGVDLEGDASRAASVAESLHLRFPTLVDARQSVARLYDVQHLPFTLLLDREGVVRGAWSGEPADPAELARQIKELEDR